MCTLNAIRCTAKLLIGIGVLYLFATIIYAVIQIVQIEQSTDFDVSSSKALWSYWYYLYPILIGFWAEITASVGICTSRKTSPSTCKTCTFSQFSIALVGFLGYLLFDFTFYFLKSLYNINNDLCHLLNKKITTNCFVKIVLEGCILSLGAIIVLLCLWCMVCCCSWICCDTHEQSRQRVGPGLEQGNEQRIPARTHGDQPNVVQAINTESPQAIPTAPILDDNYPYNPNWPPVCNAARPQTSGIAGNNDDLPPYSEFPESGPSDSIIIDRETSQAYFIRPVYPRRLPPINS